MPRTGGQHQMEKVNLSRLLGYIGGGGNAAGSIWLALNLDASPLAYWIWLVSTLAFYVHLTIEGSRWMRWLNFLFIAINIIGAYRYFGPLAGWAYAVINALALWRIHVWLGNLPAKDFSPRSGRVERTAEFANLVLSVIGAALMASATVASPYGWFVWLAANGSAVAYGVLIGSRGVIINCAGYAAAQFLAITMYFSLAVAIAAFSIYGIIVLLGMVAWFAYGVRLRQRLA